MRFDAAARRAMAATLIAAAFARAAGAEEVALKTTIVYIPPNHGGYREGAFVPPDYSIIEGENRTPANRDLGNGWGGAEAKAALSVTGTLPANDALKYKLTAEISPVSANALGQLSWTPLPFAALDCGASAGTGWSLGPIRGLAINPDDPKATEMDDTPFGGAVCSLWGGGTLQADLAAVVPGEWNHVVARTGGKIEYRANTGASDGEAWLWEADAGENFNGFRFVGSSTLGYQMPLRLNLVAVSLEATRALGEVASYSPMDDPGGWGSDFWQMTGSALASFKLTERGTITALCQAKRKAGSTDGTARLRDFRLRDYDGAYWCLNRVGFVYTLKFPGE